MSKIALFFLFCLPLFIVLRTITLEIKNSYIKDSGNVSFVVSLNPVVIISSEEENNSLTSLILPENISTSVSPTYGKYLLDNIWKLSILEKKDGSLYLNTLSNLTGIYLTGYIINQEKMFKPEYISNPLLFKKYLLEIITPGNIQNPSTFLNRNILNSNLGLLDLFRLHNRISQLNVSNIKILDGRNAQIFNKLKLADKSTVLEIDYKSFDAYLDDNFTDSKITSEQLSVAVINSSNIAGLGSRYGRFLNIIGMHLVELKNDLQKNTKNNCLVESINLNSASLKFIKKVTGCRVKVENDLEADIVVVINSL